MKNVLILGAAGMAGHMVTKFLQETQQYKILNTVRKYPKGKLNHVALDLNDHASLKNILHSFQPDVVINCAGILVQNSNTNPADAIHINSYLPHYLVQLSDTFGFKLIHISTDCVFEGTKGRYTERDIPDATTVYGKTKALGEILNHPKHLTIRTSIIGPEIKTHGTGLMHWLFNQEGAIKGYSNAIWSGVTTLELAKFIHYVLQNDSAASRANSDSHSDNPIEHSLAGLYHLTNSMPINKYELLNLIKNIFNLSHITILPDDKYRSDKSLVDSQSAQMEYTVQSYYEMITEMYGYINENQQLYNHYPIFEPLMY